MLLDGIDVDSSTNVVIESSSISTGYAILHFNIRDDHISLKSGMGEEGYQYAHPTKNVLIRNMQLGIGAGIAIGSETAGGVQDILITNNTLETSAK